MALTKKELDDLAYATIRGDYGNGDARKKNLGANYSEVQKRVNELSKQSGGTSNVKSPSTSNTAKTTTTVSAPKANSTPKVTATVKTVSKPKTSVEETVARANKATSELRAKNATSEKKKDVKKANTNTITVQKLDGSTKKVANNTVKLDSQKKVATKSPVAEKKTNVVNTEQARKNYEKKIGHEGSTSILTDEDTKAMKQAVDMMGTGEFLEKNLSSFKPTQNLQSKYGKSSKELLEMYEQDRRLKEKNKANKQGVLGLGTAKAVAKNVTQKPLQSLATVATNLVNPELAERSERAFGDELKRTIDDTANIKSGVTKDMGVVGSTAYNMGTGVVENLLPKLISTPLWVANSALNVAGDTMTSARDRDISRRASAGQALASGAVDAGLNAVGLDKLIKLDPTGNVGKDLAKQLAVGGGEQAITEIANNVIDALGSGENSLAKTTYNNYKAQGLDDNQAFWNTVKDIGGNSLMNVGTSMLMYGAMGSGRKLLSDAVNPRIPNIFTPENRADAVQPSVIKNPMFQNEFESADKSLADRVGNFLEMGENDKLSLMDRITKEDNVDDVKGMLSEIARDKINFDNSTRRSANELLSELQSRTTRGLFESAPYERTTTYEKYTNEDGIIPIQKKINEQITDIPMDELDDASQSLSVALDDSTSTGVSMNKILKNVYGQLFDDYSSEYSKPITVKNLDENGNAYNVSVNKNVVDELANKSGKYPEKFVIIPYLKQIIENANYVDSGKPDHGSNQVVRFDYLKSKIKIGDATYDVYMDVSVFPNVKNYKNHMVIDNLSLSIAEGRATNPYPSADSSALARFTSTAAADSQERLNVGNNIAQSSGAVNNVVNPSVLPRQEAEPIRNIPSPLIDTETPPIVDDFTDRDLNDALKGRLKGERINPDDVDYGTSKVISNTGRRSGAITDDDLQTDEVKEIARYAIHHNDETFQKGREDWKRDPEGLERRIISGEKTLSEDSDVHGAMSVITDLETRRKLAQQAGNEELAQELFERKMAVTRKLRSRGTQLGQFINAFKMWANTPDGAMLVGDRLALEDANKNVSKRDSKTIASMVDDLSERISNENSSGGSTNGGSKLGNYDDVIANEGKYSTKKGNKKPKTSARLDKALKEQGYDGSIKTEPKKPKTREEHAVEVVNTLKKEFGNAIFSGGVHNISNTIGAVLEGAYSKTKAGQDMERTKSLLISPEGKNLISASWKDVNENAYRPLSGMKYQPDMKSGIAGERKVFDSKVVRGFDYLNSTALSAEDMASKKIKYSTSLAGFLKANGLDSRVFEDEVNLKNLESLAQIKPLSPNENDMLKTLRAKVDVLNQGREVKKIKSALRLLFTFRMTKTLTKRLLITSRCVSR